jgi:hypothetical protein
MTTEEKKGETTTILDYFYDDPAQTTLHGKLVIPPMPKDSPDFTVVGWLNKPDVKPGTPAYQAAQVWGAIASTLSYVGFLKTPSYITQWSSVFNLVAIPRAGNQLNAYYDRSSLRFFCGKDPQTNTVIYTCDAVGIVAHELGHAILDSLRPDLWNTAVLEIFAFHEAFGDILAIASVLQHDVVIDLMVKETTSKPGEIPDLWQSNVASRLAEQLGHAIYYESKTVIGAERYLRNAYNTFAYVDPLKLPLGSSEKDLTQEPHNFGRVFSGAWYEAFCRVFAAEYVEDNPPQIYGAIRKARDTMMRALLDASIKARSELHFLPAIASEMVKILEGQKQLKEADIVKSVFKKRALWLPRFEVHPVEPVAAVVSTSAIDPSASAFHMKLTVGATNHMASQILEVQLPKFVAVHTGQNARTLVGQSVANFMNYVTTEKLLGDEGENNMFGISSDNKLVRNYICSSFHAMPQLSHIFKQT